VIQLRSDKPAAKHLVVVEAYDGLADYHSDDPQARLAARGLGLPLTELAAVLGCRVTVLTWDDFLRYETKPGAFPTWDPRATRPSDAPGPAPTADFGPAVRSVEIPARDPDHRLDLALAGCGPRLLGLLAESDPLFALSFMLERHLEELHATDPIDALVLPMRGGLGYVMQMARATGCGALTRVPVALVVTDRSADRQAADQEGLWTKPALTRRQMEDLSLALADGTLVFGPRGEAVARAGRLPDAPVPVLVPRDVPAGLLDAIATMAETPRAGRAQPFLQGPWRGSDGVLAALDGARLMQDRWGMPALSVACAGTDMTFAPMAPRRFQDYWSSRGFVREMVGAGVWRFRPGRADLGGGLPVRLCPAAASYLPELWSELARGTLPVLSPAVAEGLAPGEELPAICLLGDAPGPEEIAAKLETLAGTRPEALDQARRALCRAVVRAHRGAGRVARFEALVETLRGLTATLPERQDLGLCARLLLDRRRSLAEIAAEPQPARPFDMDLRPGTLAVVVACYEMGALLVETVESVWAATRRPDELIVVDDGSPGAATREAIARLEAEARARRLPLHVLRQPNRGLSGARNTGLQAARSEFVSFIDGDDLIGPDFYRLALNVMCRHPEIGGVAAWAETFGEGVAPGFWNAPQPELPALLVENMVFVPCMMRTALLRGLGGYDAGQRFNYEDWELPVRLLAAGHPIVTLPRYQQRYRVRGDSLLRSLTDVQNQVMRERMLETHRATAARFAMELPMLIEGRAMRREADRQRMEALRAAAPPPAPSSALQGLRRAGQALRRAAGTTAAAFGLVDSPVTGKNAR